MDKLASIKIKQNDGTYSDPIPVSVLAENVECNNGNYLDEILGSVDLQEKGNIQYQLNQLLNTKISVSELNNYVYNNLEQTVTGWLDSNIEPGEGDIVIDKSLSIEGAAADAKATTDTFCTKTEMNQVIAVTAGDIRWETPQGTHDTYPITVQGNRIIINGTVNATTARTLIYGPILRIKSSAPLPSRYPELYLDPITTFIPGHTIKVKIKLISGSYTLTGKYNSFYIDLRNVENGETAENPWIFHDEDEMTINFQPQTIIFGIPKGEYHNVTFEFSITDMDIINKVKIFKFDNSILQPIMHAILLSNNNITFDAPFDKIDKECITNLIPLPKNAVIAHNGYAYGNYRAIVFYDDNKNPIASKSNQTLPMTSVIAPEGASYFRLGHFGTQSNYNFQVEIKVPSSEEFQYLLKIIKLKSDIELYDFKINNLFTLSNTEISAQDGTAVYNAISNYFATDFIKLPNNISVKIIGSYGYTNPSHARVAFYDLEKNFISAYASNSGRLIPINIPDNAKYVRFNTHSTTVPPENCRAYTICTGPKNDSEIIDLIRNALIQQ